MNEQAMSEALDAIHNEALKLMECDLPPEVERKIALILSLARYKFDVRSSQEQIESNYDDDVEHEEEHEQNGVKYRIMAVSDEGWLWGKWFCRACNESGESSKRCSNVEDAVQAAHVNLGTHHAIKHRSHY